MITFNIKDIQQLRACYFPFVAQGAVFIESDQSVKLGETILIMLSYPNLKKAPVLGKVVWINFENVGNHQQGFAVQLSDKNGQYFNHEFSQIFSIS